MKKLNHKPNMKHTKKL